MANRRLTNEERTKLNDVMSGKLDPNSKKGGKFLNQPHISVAFEEILNTANLTNEKLAEKMNDIISRDSITNVAPSGIKSTNQTAIDANALNAIRMVWQIRGKFTDKTDVTHRGAIGEMSDEQLDKIIKAGGTYFNFKKTQMEHKRGEKDKNDAKNPRY